MLAVIVSSDRFLSDTLTTLCRAVGFRVVRTNKLDRVTRELKQPHRIAIIDTTLEELHTPGTLRQLVNVGRILDNKVVCICPNQDEDLKRLAKNARPSEVFLRYDLHSVFKQYMAEEAVRGAEKETGS